MVRGIAVGFSVYLVTIFWVHLPLVHPWYILGFALMGSAMMGALGIVAGICTEKFDQLAAFQNFIIMPLTFLSGVFYSIHSLPPLWHQISRFNPFFYIIGRVPLRLFWAGGRVAGIEFVHRILEFCADIHGYFAIIEEWLQT